MPSDHCAPPIHAAPPTLAAGLWRSVRQRATYARVQGLLTRGAGGRVLRVAVRAVTACRYYRQVSVRFAPPRVCRPFAWAILTVAWAAVIFVLSAQPNLRFVPDATLDYGVRKAGHIMVFGLLAVFAWRTLSETRWPRPPAAWALLATILYAASDELHQCMVEGRHPALVDVGIDALGAGAGLFLVTRLARRWRRPGT